MIQSLQVEGTSLLVAKLDQKRLEKIYNSGFIKNFVLSETLLGQSLIFPYFQILQKSQVDQIKTLSQSGLFLGYILKLSDQDPIPSFQGIKYLDLEVTSFKKTVAFLKKLDPKFHARVFLSLKSGHKVSEINQVISWIEKKQNPLNIEFFKKPYDLDSNEWQDWADLEFFEFPRYQQSLSLKNPKYSVIIPHYESQFFVVNVLKHLSRIDHFEDIEVLLVDDGSDQKTLDYIQYCASHLFPQLNFQILSWPDKPLLNSKEKIFRAGSSRNWGAQMARASRLLFLDSDMLVPANLTSLLDRSFQKADVIQFKRLHIPPTLSTEKTDYQKLLENPALYIEESNYWSQLFESEDWMKIQDHWKMTCTYALAIEKTLFDQMGRFRRNFIRYGFEDTDLGFRLSRKKCRFYLEKTPLLHLTKSDENTQSWFFKIKKMNRIKKMAQVFYMIHLDSKIFQLFRMFY